jgi:predicted small lipoprotein YifL
MKTRLLIPKLLLSALASLVSCKEKGPVEKAGEQIDKSVEKVKDAVNPKGPIEKAGEKVDKAIGN